MRQSQLVAPSRFSSIRMISRVKAFGRTRISSRRRRNRSRNHLLRTHEQSRGSARSAPVRVSWHRSAGGPALLTACRQHGNMIGPATGTRRPGCGSCGMSFSSSRGRSSKSFRNLHTRANRPRCQLTELWERATGPLIGCAKRYMARLTWRGSRALDGASIAISSEPSDAEVGICA